MGEGPLAGVEGEKFLRAEMHRSGDVEDIECPMALLRGSLEGIGVGESEDESHVARDEHKEPGGYIRLPIRNHVIGLALAESFVSILRMQPDLQANGLNKFKFE